MMPAKSKSQMLHEAHTQREQEERECVEFGQQKYGQGDLESKYSTGS